MDDLEAKLNSYLDDELTATERKQVEGLIASNATARALLAELSSARRLLASLPKERAPSEVYEHIEAQLERTMLLADAPVVTRVAPHRKTPIFWSAAAVMALTFGLGWVVVNVISPPGAAPIATSSSADDVNQSSDAPGAAAMPTLAEPALLVDGAGSTRPAVVEAPVQPAPLAAAAQQPPSTLLRPEPTRAESAHSESATPRPTQTEPSPSAQATEARDAATPPPNPVSAARAAGGTDSSTHNETTSLSALAPSALVTPPMLAGRQVAEKQAEVGIAEPAATRRSDDPLARASANNVLSSRPAGPTRPLGAEPLPAIDSVGSQPAVAQSKVEGIPPKFQVRLIEVHLIPPFTGNPLAVPWIQTTPQSDAP